MEVSWDDFEALVAEVMDDVPEPFASALDEVAVVVEERAPHDMGSLYGLYQGVPLTEGVDVPGVLPAKISIYRRPMLDHCRSEEEVCEQVRVTVLHELGHHLGFDERRLDDLGYG